MQDRAPMPCSAPHTSGSTTPGKPGTRSKVVNDRGGRILGAGVMVLRHRVTRILSIVALFVALRPATAPRAATTRPDLQGVWSGSTLTPLQRPADFKDR